MDKFTLYSEDTVLMIIDIQERMMPVMDYGKQVVSKTVTLIKTAEKLGRRKIIVTGMETHVCVLQTVRGLLELGYQVFLAGDAVSSRTKHNYRNALAMMHNMGAVITNTETVFFDLMKQAGTPVFKELSFKYIK